jgi:hypothetical protein
MCVMVNEKLCLLKKSVINIELCFFNTKLDLLNKKNIFNIKNSLLFKSLFILFLFY